MVFVLVFELEVDDLDDFLEPGGRPGPFFLRGMLCDVMRLIQLLYGNELRRFFWNFEISLNECRDLEVVGRSVVLIVVVCVFVFVVVVEC